MLIAVSFGAMGWTFAIADGVEPSAECPIM